MEYIVVVVLLKAFYDLLWSLVNELKFECKKFCVHDLFKLLYNRKTYI